jgi:hypothetical protein
MENLSGAIWLECSDFDLDGDYDMIATGMGETSLVCYENDGREGLTRINLDGGLQSGFALNVVDLDRDGDDDVVAIGMNSNTLAWWENKLSRTCFLDSPKWIDYSDDDQLMFVSNEEEGSIVRIEADGRQHCIRNSLPICTGLSYSDGFLWVAAGTSIYKLDPLNGISRSSFRLPAQFLSGLSSDAGGNLYSTDPYSGILFKSDSETGETESLTTGLDYPQSIKYDSNLDKLIVLDGEYSTTIKCIDPVSGSITNAIETQILPGGDIIPDKIGNHYISSPEAGLIYALTNDFSDPVFQFSEGHNTPTGLVYFSEDKKLGMLSTELDSLIVIPATATGVNNHDASNYQDFKIYPNPVEESLFIKFPCASTSLKVITIRSISGQVALIQNIGPGVLNAKIDLEGTRLGEGIYFVDIEGAGVKFRKKFIKR